MKPTSSKHFKKATDLCNTKCEKQNQTVDTLVKNLSKLSILM